MQKHADRELLAMQTCCMQQPQQGTVTSPAAAPAVAARAAASWTDNSRISSRIGMQQPHQGIAALPLVLLPKNACKLASWQGPHLETASALDHPYPSRSDNEVDGKGVRVLKALRYAQTHYLNRHSS